MNDNGFINNIINGSSGISLNISRFNVVVSVIFVVAAVVVVFVVVVIVAIIFTYYYC